MTFKDLKTIISQGENMNILMYKKNNAVLLNSLLLVNALFFTACSQQPAAIPEATGGVNTHHGSGNEGGNTGSTAGHGSNTQGANIGKGGGVRSTGAGGGYPANGNQGGSTKENNSAITLANLNNPNSLLSKRIIYFDYNLASIKPQYQAILDAHTKLLASHPNVKVRLEGHADERGTREYNIALSEERAKAVQWSMRSKGVSSRQTEVIAYGEERPAVVGDGEKSWAQNRRVEIKYPGR